MRVLTLAQQAGCGCGVRDLALVDSRRRSLLCVRHWHPLPMAEVSERPDEALVDQFERILPAMPPSLLDRPAAMSRPRDVIERHYAWIADLTPKSLVELHGRFLWYRTPDGTAGSLPIP